MQLELFEDGEKKSELDYQETLVCIDCGVEKPMSEYYTYDYVGVTGNRRKCIPCYNENGKRVYKLKKENPYPYENPVCDSCGAMCHDDPLSLDHDHNTGLFRGYLCRSCNVGIGQLGDSIAGLEVALAYLKRHYER